MKYTPDNFNWFLEYHPIIREIYSEEYLKEFVNNFQFSDDRFNDYLWGLFNRSLIKVTDFFENKEEGFWRITSQIYSSMSLFLAKEGFHTENIHKYTKTINKYKRKAFQAQVNEYSAGISKDYGKGGRPIYKIEVIGMPECDYAKSVDENKYDIEDFMEHCHIATDKCNDRFGYCRCGLGLTLLRDENGRIIRR